MSNISEKGKSRADDTNTNVSPYLMKFMSDPTDFSGDIRRTNPMSWIKKMERIKNFGRLDDENMLIIAVDHLVDQASCWFNVTHPDPERLTWNEFKTSFMAKYCSGRMEVWWEEINSMKQKSDETVEDIEIKMRELYQLVGVKDEAMIKRTFLKAIKPEIALEVERNGVEEETSLQELIKKAIKFERFLKKYQNKGLVAVPRKMSSNASEASYNPYAQIDDHEQMASQSIYSDPMSELIREFRERKVSLLKATNSAASGTNNYNKVTNNNNGKKSWACFYCKEEGHRKADCPKFKKDAQEGKVQESGKDRARQ